MKNKKHKFMRVASLALAASLSFSTMTAFAGKHLEVSE